MTVALGESVPAQADIALQVRDLHIGLKARERVLPVVHGISFAIRRGESLGLVGESGAGKSVTALALLGLLPNNSFTVSGSIVVGGIELDSLTERRIHSMRGRELFMILQDASTCLNPSMTVDRQLCETLKRRRINSGLNGPARQALLQNSLQEVGIENAARCLKCYPHQLSGGMRQRVVIAMAYLANPQLLIADEPTSALDVLTQHTVLSLLRSLQLKHHNALLFVSHDLRAVARICDTVAVMYAGRIVEYGPVSRVIASPRHPYSRALLRSIPSLAQRSQTMFTIPGDPPSIYAKDPGCPFVSRCDRALERCVSQFPPSQLSIGGASFCCWNPVDVQGDAAQ